MIYSKKLIEIFNLCILDYHVLDTVNQEMQNPFEKPDIKNLLYLKCWIDTVQWHYEDLIRSPSINSGEGMKLKRLIDASNQHRTDVVEQIDDWYLDQFKEVQYNPDARLNSESPAWVVDRISILTLKIFHMKEQADRPKTDDEHKLRIEKKLRVLMEQKEDLSMSYDQLVEDIANGNRVMKVYRQMKMYNDPSTNPVLYNKKT